MNVIIASKGRDFSIDCITRNSKMPYTGRMVLVFTATWSKNSYLQDLLAA